MKLLKLIAHAMVLLSLAFSVPSAMAQPARDPHTPGYVAARELPDGVIPSPDSSGNFIIGPTHNPAPQMTVQANVPQGTVYKFTIDSKESKIYPGIAREPKTFGTVDSGAPAKLIVTTSHPAPYTRRIAVYVPKQYVPGTAAPFIVGADGPDDRLFTALDNLIADNKVPAMIAISIGNGSGDAQGSERGLEYDTMSGLYAEFVEKEILPLVESKCQVKLTKDPSGRATMGASSGGSCALIMAWYHPEWYHRVLTWSGTYVNQQWPYNPKTPHGAWEFHEHLIPESRKKPLRIWMEVGDQDLFNPNIMRDNMHDWVLANENMAKVLAAKGYDYQFIFARNARHVDSGVKSQTLPEALEWLWKGYQPEKNKKFEPQTTHMKKLISLSFITCLFFCSAKSQAQQGGWVSLFDGKSLTGWKVGDNAETFSVKDSMIIVHGKTAHLFYDGDVQGHNFKNFEFKADVMTHLGANSGIYIHTGYQQGGWPAKGYEIQVNNSHTDWRRTGSVYGIDDIKEVYVKDNEWFTMDITVQGKRIIVKINDRVVKDYTEPADLHRTGGDAERVLSSGTFALQGHDPNSLVFFKNIMVKPLP